MSSIDMYAAAVYIVKKGYYVAITIYHNLPINNTILTYNMCCCGDDEPSGTKEAIPIADMVEIFK